MYNSSTHDPSTRSRTLDTARQAPGDLNANALRQCCSSPSVAFPTGALRSVLCICALHALFTARRLPASTSGSGSSASQSRMTDPRRPRPETAALETAAAPRPKIRKGPRQCRVWKVGGPEMAQPLVHCSRRDGSGSESGTESDSSSSDSDSDSAEGDGGSGTALPRAPSEKQHETREVFLRRVKVHLRAHRSLMRRTNCPDDSSSDEDAEDAYPYERPWWVSSDRPSTASLLEESAEARAAAAGGWGKLDEGWDECWAAAIGGGWDDAELNPQEVVHVSPGWWAPTGVYGQLHRLSCSVVGDSKSDPVMRTVSCPELPLELSPLGALPTMKDGPLSCLSFNGKAHGCPWQSKRSSRRHRRQERSRETIKSRPTEVPTSSQAEAPQPQQQPPRMRRRKRTRNQRAAEQHVIRMNKTPPRIESPQQMAAAKVLRIAISCRLYF